MVYTQNVLPESINSKVSIGPVVKNNQIEEFNKLLLSIFQMPTGWLEAFSDFTKHSIRVGWQFFLAYSETKPLGVSALFSSGGVGGIYDVGTLEAFRGQGIGSILTLHTLRLSFDAGNRLHTLQAVNGGAAERLYQKLGFTVDHLVEFYSKQL